MGKDLSNVEDVEKILLGLFQIIIEWIDECGFDSYIDFDDVQTELMYSDSQPRDESGKWADGGGGVKVAIGRPTSSAATPKKSVPLRYQIKNNQMRIRVAKKLGIDPSKLHSD